MNRQFYLACMMIFFGCTLLAVGFAVAPAGEIHSSVLVAFGEILTFAGALIGIDYVYRNRGGSGAAGRKRQDS